MHVQMHVQVHRLPDAACDTPYLCIVHVMICKLICASIAVDSINA
jgi:hypothetical protein